MPTVDKNGIVEIIGTDSLVPFSALLNTIGSSVSGALSPMKDDLVYKASSLNAANTLKNNLVANGHVFSSSNLLIVYRTDTEILHKWNGASWSDLIPKAINTPQSGTVQVPSAGGTYISSTTVTFTTPFTGGYVPSVLCSSTGTGTSSGTFVSYASNITPTGFVCNLKTTQGNNFQTGYNIMWIAL